MKLLVLLISFAIVMVFLVTLAMILERYWRKHQTEWAANKEETESSGVNPLAASVSRLTEQVRSLVQPQQKDETLVKQFQEWVTRDLRTDSAVQSWLLALPEPGFAMLTEHIAAFCTEMNFDLQWLVSQQAAVAPELKAAMQGVVVDYCRACQKAVQVQPHAKAFADYQRLLQNPKGKPEQALSRTLYANLTSQGLSPAPDSAELINATESERHQKALQAIQQAAAKDWSKFAQILQATMTPIDAVPTPPNGQHANGQHANGKPENGQHANGKPENSKPGQKREGQEAKVTA